MTWRVGEKTRERETRAKSTGLRLGFVKKMEGKKISRDYQHRKTRWGDGGKNAETGTAWLLALE